MKLLYNFSFEDLYDNKKIALLHSIFEDFVKAKNNNIFVQYKSSNAIEEELLISLSILLEEFLINFFNLDLQDYQNKLALQNKLYRFHSSFVKKRVLLKYKNVKFDPNFESIKFDSEEDLVDHVEILLENEQENIEEILEIEKYIAWTIENKKCDNSIIFTQIFDKKDSWVHDDNGIINCTSNKLSDRKGFNLYNSQLQDENRSFFYSKYCLICHKRKIDKCSDRPHVKNKNPLSKGCPLGQKISEMNLVRSFNKLLAALSIIMIDNPMCFGTGYRICNDCEKGCIYTTQLPVNITMIESNILDFVLGLDYGFEIYSLLTRWNPLSKNRIFLNDDTKKKVLIVGLGPAGYTLAHYLLNEGHTIVAIDGAKIEYLDEKISGLDYFCNKVKFLPIKNIKQDVFKDLEKRVILGIGGVSEYGITSRWNKNYLTIAYLILSRRKNFNMYGGIRFGGNIGIDESILQFGFDHICLAIGNNSPRVNKSVDSFFYGGIYFANDFLMNLHLNSPNRIESFSTMRLCSPILVIGGGLTAVDAATESIAYYFAQIEKLHVMYCKIIKTNPDLNSIFEERELKVLNRLLDDFSHITDLRSKGMKDSEIALEKKIVSIVYRGKLQDCSAYRSNRDELFNAFSEGVGFIENASLIDVIRDEDQGIYKSILNIDGKYKEVESRTIIIAIGNVRKHCFIKDVLKSNHFSINKEAVDILMTGHFPNDRDKSSIFVTNKKNITVFGDMHPGYSGSVVNAMASAKNLYQDVSDIVNASQANNPVSSELFFDKLADYLIPRVSGVKKLTENLSILIIQSPLSVSRFFVGAFYKLQTYNHSGFASEPVVLSPYKIYDDKICFVIKDSGVSSKICQNIKIGDRVVLMGPNGSQIKIVNNQNIMMIGGGVGNAALLPIGSAFKKANCKVVHFCSFRKFDDAFECKEFQSASDITVWSCDIGGEILKQRKQDLTFESNLFEAIQLFNKYSNSDDRERIKLSSIDKVIIVGSESMMHAFYKFINSSIGGSIFKDSCEFFVSINTTMQCTLKGLCGQCILDCGSECVFTCDKHDLDLKKVDFNVLKSRLSHNRVQEKLSYLYYNNCDWML